MHDKHLLVPLDGSAIAESVLPVARMLASSLDADITLFSALPASLQPAATRDPLDSLRQVTQELQSRGVDARFVFRLGDPADEILEFVRTTPCDLLIMATHGRSGLSRSLFGSVTDQVLRSSRVPLVLLHPNAHQTEQLRTILVPIDGTPGGAVALAHAVPLALAAHARVIVVRAAVPLPLWIYDPVLGLNTGPLIDPMWQEDARRAAEVHAEGVAARLQRAGLTAEGRGISGRPAPAIVAAADEVDCDLIVMSTHGRAGPVRSVLGSVADEVVRTARRPVLLVRREPAPQESRSGTSTMPILTA
jgi:nucleotide-binding universal stress UspA family protein